MTPWVCTNIGTEQLPNYITLAQPNQKQCVDAHSVTTKTVHGKSGTSPSFSIEDSYENLFLWQYKRKPTTTELANISDTDAKDWFHDKFKISKHFLWNSWYVYPSDMYTTTRTDGGQLCFSMGIAPCTPDLNQVLFSGEVTWPNGKKCAIEPMRYSNYPGGSFTFKVHLRPPCPDCN